jgi:molecular chaperone Hsp33
MLPRGCDSPQLLNFVTTMPDNDSLQRFLFEQTNVRGELVHLDATWRAVLERRDYPPVVRDLLGEAMAAAVLLGATIKYRGSLIMQIQGKGPISLLVVQVTSGRTLRGMAQWEGELKPGSLKELFGDGTLVITIEPEAGRERYQGIVGLGDAGLSQALEGYFQRSEQLATRLWLAADTQRAAGLLLQEMPSESHDPDAWSRVVHLGSTITSPELLELSFLDVIRRLYHEEDVRIFDAEPVSFRCSCSRGRIVETLRGLGYDEVRDILNDQGTVSVDCSFCNQHYEFDAVDVERIFASGYSPEVPKTKH